LLQVQRDARTRRSGSRRVSICQPSPGRLACTSMPRRVVAVALGALMAVAVLAYTARRPLLTAAGRFLVVEEPPRSAEAIVVLSGSIPDRILEAVDLYQAGLAPRIILTQEGPLPGLAAARARGVTLPEHHEQNISIAEQLGVPSAAITVVRTPAWST